MTPLNSLRNFLGDIVLTDDSSRFAASFDGMKLSFIPEAVIKPTLEDHVGITLKLANQHKIPVTTRGAGSSLTGSASPLKGGWVIDLSLLNSITIDPLKRLAYAGPGATTQNIQQQALEHNLFYPPDPASSKFCTIGGNIACNAGGPRCVKYGVTRDYIVALRGFLPTGEKVSWGLPLKKFAVGYNIRDLWVGSEGTLGIITHAVLKLIPKPLNRWTCLTTFDSEITALETTQNILNTNITPSSLEFLDTLTISGAQKATNITLFHSPKPLCCLIIELDGNNLDQDIETLLTQLSQASQILHAPTQAVAESFWQFRRECSSAMFQHGNAKLNEDIVVPIEKLIELTIFTKKLAADTHLKIPVFGHAGDGNFHVNIMYNRDDPTQCSHAETALQSLMEKVIELGGAISGEHGIGLAKSPFLRLQYSNTEINTMLAIKKALDPNNILNPGKIFHPFQVWQHKPVTTKLPWDRL